MKRWIPFLIIFGLIVAGTVYLNLQKKPEGDISQFLPGIGEKVICTTYPVYLFTRTIAKGSPLRVETLIPPGTGCPHDYVLSPHDILKLDERNCLLLKNGLGLDDAICDAACKVNRTLVVTDISDASRALKAENHEVHKAEGHEEHHHHHHHHDDDGMNPHQFASPDTALLMAEKIMLALCAKDPKNQELYKKNFAEFKAKLEKLAGEYKSAGLQGKKLCVQHNVFDYMANLCGMDSSVNMNADENQELSASQVTNLKREIKEKNVSLIVAEPQYSPKFAELLCRETGVKFVTLDPCSSGPDKMDGDYYIRVMEQNLKTLKENLCN